MKTCLMTYANNKGADQPAHPHSLISAIVVCCLDSMICILSMYVYLDSMICILVISKVSRF